MGSCFSFLASAATAGPPTAKVITPEGSLMEYSLPVKASRALGSYLPSFFLCNADDLFYGHFIQALDADCSLELGKLYFLLPEKRLSYPLTAAEMSELASRARSALTGAPMAGARKQGLAGGSGRLKGVRILPIVEEAELDCYERFNEDSVGSWKAERAWRKKGGMKQKAFRGGSAAINRRIFRPRLSVIQEVVE